MKHLSTFFVSVKLWLHSDMCIWAPSSWSQRTSSVYRVSQEECARLREGVPYVKVSGGQLEIQQSNRAPLN
jgi:hypothetical protein